MALKDVWIPQNETMDASPEIPNMLANAIIQNEIGIKELKDGGGSGGSELFEIQWDGKTGNATFPDVFNAIQIRKIPALYQGHNCIATFAGENNNGEFVFVQSDLVGRSCVTEYILPNLGEWSVKTVNIVKKEIISADNEEFKTAVLNCFPDADTMSFPLEETVSEVNEE